MKSQSDRIKDIARRLAQLSIELAELHNEIHISAQPSPKDALANAKRAAGGLSALARLLGTTPQAVSQWKQVPASRVLEVERVTRVSRKLLRPDLYETRQ